MISSGSIAIDDLITGFHQLFGQLRFPPGKRGIRKSAAVICIENLGRGGVEDFQQPFQRARLKIKGRVIDEEDLFSAPAQLQE